MGDVLVTGATGGIGSAVVGALSAAGHKVTALGRDAAGLDQLKDNAAATIVADLRDVASLGPALAGLDQLDALIHCAGFSAVAPVADTQAAVWEETLTVNVTAAAEVTRLLLPALRRSRGHVVFVNSAPGMRAAPQWSAFVASKAALRELADTVRLEEAAHGIRVTTVFPAGTATDMLRRTREAFGRPYDPASSIQPETLASMISWALASPPDAYVCELGVYSSPQPRG
jgi:NADP-dependent 3-hydroxy acid dehydrogenase YdfG